jgi:indoleacetamide hydrolase
MNRRLLLKLLAATSLNPVARPASATSNYQILDLDCAKLVAHIREGTVCAEEVCAAYLKQHERRQSLNVITSIDPASVLSRAREIDRARASGKALPALAGLPILIKDNIDVVGLPTSAGTPALRKYFPRRSSPVVERLLLQGAVVLGKANMHELALGVSCTNPTFGPVRNPYNPQLIPGGSSGGSAAAVAARVAPAALGTDTGGSVRIPAALCGTVGFRPSTHPRQLYSQEGVVPFAADLDTIGPMGRCVEDVALLHATIVGNVPARAGSLEHARLGVPGPGYWEDLDPEVERVARAVLDRLRERGAELVQVDMSGIKDAAMKIAATLQSRMTSEVEQYLRTHVPSLSMQELIEHIGSADLRAALKSARTVTSEARLLHAKGPGRASVRAAYLEVFREHGIRAVVFPTVVLPAPPIGRAGNDLHEMIEFNGRTIAQVQTVVRNTIPTAVFGAPALTLPAGLTGEGLPVGVEFDGLPGDDTALLALGMAAESVIGRVAPPKYMNVLSTANS